MPAVASVAKLSITVNIDGRVSSAMCFSFNRDALSIIPYYFVYGIGNDVLPFIELQQSVCKCFLTVSVLFKFSKNAMVYAFSRRCIVI